MSPTRQKFLFLAIFFFIAYQCFACMREEKHEVVLSSGKENDFSDIYMDRSRGRDRLRKVIDLSDIYMDQSKVKDRLKSAGKNLSDSDIDMIADFITRGLCVMEQAEQEYSEKMKEINSEKCPQWEQIERKGKWTAYIETKNRYWFNGECYWPRC